MYIWLLSPVICVANNLLSTWNPHQQGVRGGHTRNGIHNMEFTHMTFHFRLKGLGLISSHYPSPSPSPRHHPLYFHPLSQAFSITDIFLIGNPIQVISSLIFSIRCIFPRRIPYYHAFFHWKNKKERISKTWYKCDRTAIVDGVASGFPDFFPVSKTGDGKFLKWHVTRKKRAICVIKCGLGAVFPVFLGTSIS